MLVLGGRASTPGEGRAEIERRLRAGDGLARFAELVRAQHGDDRVVAHPERLPQAPVQVEARSPSAGVVAAIDAAAVGATAMRLGAGRLKKGDPVDHAVGVVLRAAEGDAVRAGDTLAVVHARTETAAAAAAGEIAGAYTMAASAPGPAPLVRAVVE
jgi:pyrimidine-nucleoside phosphorylase